MEAGLSPLCPLYAGVCTACVKHLICMAERLPTAHDTSCYVPRLLTKEQRDILLNEEIIAVNQDALGVAGDLVWKEGPQEVGLQLQCGFCTPCLPSPGPAVSDDLQTPEPGDFVSRESP